MDPFKIKQNPFQNVNGLEKINQINEDEIPQKEEIPEQNFGINSEIPIDEEGLVDIPDIQSLDFINKLSKKDFMQ